MPRLAWMRLQNRVTTALKVRLIADGAAPRQVRFGVAAGTTLVLDRHYDLQREFGLYEREAMGVYRRWIRPDDVVFDVGASDGYSALGFAKLAARGQVVAFEFDVLACAAFRRNVELNPTLATRVDLMTTSVGRAVGPSETSIDYVVGSLIVPPPQFVKIDVEGAEMDVLTGMIDVMRKVRPIVFVEVHSADLERQCGQFLRSENYRSTIVRNAWWRTLYPEFRPLAHNRWLLGAPVTLTLPR